MTAAYFMVENRTVAASTASRQCDLRRFRADKDPRQALKRELKSSWPIRWRDSEKWILTNPPTDDFFPHTNGLNGRLALLWLSLQPVSFVQKAACWLLAQSSDCVSAPTRAHAGMLYPESPADLVGSIKVRFGTDIASHLSIQPPPLSLRILNHSQIVYACGSLRSCSRWNSAWYGNQRQKNEHQCDGYDQGQSPSSQPHETTR